MPNPTPVTEDKIKELLESQLKTIEETVPKLAEKATDAANEEIARLKESQEELTTALEKLKEAAEQKKTFGIPGLSEDIETANKQKKNLWSWHKYMLAQYLIAASGKGITGVPNVRSEEEAWKVANNHVMTDGPKDFEQRLCSEYSTRRRDVYDRSVIKGYESDDGSQGGFLVPPEISNEIIDLVIAQMPLLNMPGVMRLSGLHGDLAVPRVLSRNTGYHVGEVEAPTESTGSFGLEWLRPKKVGTFTKQSNRLLYQTRGVSDRIVKQVLSEGVSLEWHRGLLNGKGSESEAKGLLKYANDMTTSYLSNNTLSAGNARFKLKDAIQMQQALDNVDELRDTGNYGYLMHPQAYWGMIRQNTVQYSGQSLEDGAPVDGINVIMNKQRLAQVLGYEMKTSTQFPTTDNKTSAVFGDWSKFWSATFREPIFKVSDTASDGSTGSAFLQDQLYLVMFVEYDCRCMRPAAFSIIDDISTNESNWTS